MNDDYLGSGKLLKRAINLHGKENFHREILFNFTTEEEMNAKERELITEDLIKSDGNYNLCLGGQGGFSYLNNHSESKKWKQKGQKAVMARKSEWLPKVVEERIKKYGDCFGGKAWRLGGPSFKGKQHSEQTKEKISKGNRKNHSGAKNSQFGTMWITDGISSMKIKKSDLIPEGWKRGRKIKNYC